MSSCYKTTAFMVMDSGWGHVARVGKFLPTLGVLPWEFYLGGRGDLQYQIPPPPPPVRLISTTTSNLSTTLLRPGYLPYLL